MAPPHPHTTQGPPLLPPRGGSSNGSRGSAAVGSVSLRGGVVPKGGHGFSGHGGAAAGPVGWPRRGSGSGGDESRRSSSNSVGIQTSTRDAGWNAHSGPALARNSRTSLLHGDGGGSGDPRRGSEEQTTHGGHGWPGRSTPRASTASERHGGQARASHASVRRASNAQSARGSRPGDGEHDRQSLLGRPSGVPSHVASEYGGAGQGGGNRGGSSSSLRRYALNHSPERGRPGAGGSARSTMRSGQHDGHQGHRSSGWHDGGGSGSGGGEHLHQHQDGQRSSHSPGGARASGAMYAGGGAEHRQSVREQQPLINRDSTASSRYASAHAPPGRDSHYYAPPPPEGAHSQRPSVAAWPQRDPMPRPSGAPHGLHAHAAFAAAAQHQPHYTVADVGRERDHAGGRSRGSHSHRDSSSTPASLLEVRQKMPEVGMACMQHDAKWARPFA